MIILIKDQQLSATCSSESALIKQFGDASGKRINRRLCTLASATCVDDISREPPDSLKIVRSDSGLHFCVGCSTHGYVYFEAVVDVPSQMDLAQVRKIVLTKLKRGE